MFMLPQRQSLGEILGQAIGNVAEQWAEHRSTRKALEGLGFNDQEARAYAKLGPQATHNAIQARQQEQARERSASITQSLLNEGLGGQQPAAQPYQQPYQQPTAQPMSTGIPKRMLPHEQQAEAIQQATGIAQNPAYRKLQEQQQQALALQQQQQARGSVPQGNQLTGEQQAILQAQDQQAHKEPSYKERLEDVQRRRRALVAAPISDSDKREGGKILQDQEAAIRDDMRHAEDITEKRRSNDIKEKESAYKINKKERTAIHERGELARKNIQDLKQVKKYNATGTLIQGKHRAALEAFGLEDFYTNEPTQVVDKILQGLRVGIGKAYGTSRITNLLAESYDKTLPRMINTKEGMDAVIDNKILDERGEELVQQSLRSLEKRYQQANLLYPLDIIEQARENVRTQLDKLGEEGLKNIDNFIKRDNAKIIKQLPPAAAHKSESKIHAARGIRATSDGKEWVITPL